MEHRACIHFSCTRPERMSYSLVCTPLGSPVYLRTESPCRFLGFFYPFFWKLLVQTCSLHTVCTGTIAGRTESALLSWFVYNINICVEKMNAQAHKSTRRINFQMKSSQKPREVFPVLSLGALWTWYVVPIFPLSQNRRAQFAFLLPFLFVK